MSVSSKINSYNKKVFLWLAGAFLLSSCGAAATGQKGVTERDVRKIIAIMQQDFNYEEGFTLAEAGYIHYIKDGETIWALAQKYDVPVENLLAINDIKEPTKLAVGTRIYIPKTEESEIAVAKANGKTPASQQKNTNINVALSQAKKESQANKEKNGDKKFKDLCWPVEGTTITSRFGERWGKKHSGIDMGSPLGTPIRAAAAGKVILSAFNASGYGNVVLIMHDNGYFTLYAHNQRNLVQEGERVKRCQQIAELGSTGRSTGPHCHFEVREGETPKNPLEYLEP